uniref:Uncharacterized protein n=1 Tax=Ditylenchus dipsaci TaxID=166011 RepID=A0A915DZV2_9BILA
MRMYKMEQEVLVQMAKGGGRSSQAVHSVQSEWDDTLVKIKIIERLPQDTGILHQLHRKIWPSHNASLCSGREIECV